MRPLVSVEPPVLSPLSLGQLTRDTWGQFDCSAIAQLAPLAGDPCFQLKFYKAPADNQDSFGALQFQTYGLRITPGSIIYGFYLPVQISRPGAPVITWAPPDFTVQITDVSLNHKWFDAPLASLFLANAKPRYQAGGSSLNVGTFPNLLTAPYPVTGAGLFRVDIQETSGSPQRIQLVFGVLEVCG